MAAYNHRRALALLLLQRRERRARGRRWWVHPLNQRRREQGAFYHLVQELQLDEQRYREYFRMTPNQMDRLLAIVGPALKRTDTNYRDSIEPAQQLAVALRFLATGESFKSLAYSYRLGRQTVAECICCTCEAIINLMMETHLPTPTESAWEDIADRFCKKWNFPNCLGAIDGKHITVQAPPNSGSLFFNYKKTFSIVLLALVDADYRFRVVQVGDYGRNSDAGIYAVSPLGKRMEEGTLNVPRNTPLPGSGELGEMPFVMVGDAAFPLRTYLMRPYPGKDLPKEKEIFNYRLSRARMVVEGAFGILSARWRALHTKLNMLPEHVDKVVLAACLLHNYLVSPQEARVLLQEADDCGQRLEQAERLRPVGANRAGRAAYTVQDMFATYFSGEGRVNWQDRVVNRGRLGGQGGQ